MAPNEGFTFFTLIPGSADEPLDEDGDSDGEDGEADRQLVEEGQRGEQLPSGEHLRLQPGVDPWCAYTVMLYMVVSGHSPYKTLSIFWRMRIA